MPKRTSSTPRYCRHKGSGQAVVTIDGHDIYLGKWNSAASKREYERLIGEWLTNGRRLPSMMPPITINELILAYWKFAEGYYRKDGKVTGELHAVKSAMRLLRRLYGHTPAREFGPLALKAVREQMIEIGWCRTNVNAQVLRVRRVFRWGVENELIPAETIHALRSVPGLRKGRANVREREPVRPVCTEDVEAVLPHVSIQVAAMIRLQLLTGMRPGEVVGIRSIDIDRTRPVWEYTPPSHKTQHHGHRRVVFLGPRAQRILRPFLQEDESAYLFDARAAVGRFHADRAARRRTPCWPSHMTRNKRVRKESPKREPRAHLNHPGFSGDRSS